MADRVKRLREIADAIARGDRSELTMRVPAEPDRDADLVVSWAADEIERLRTRQSCEGDQPYICHALATARSRLADWHKVADDRSAEIVRLNARLAEAIAEGNHWKDAYAEDVSKLDARLAEADALLLMTKWSVLCVAEDAYRAHRLDISDSQYALLNRIDAALLGAADSATHREGGSHG